MSKPAYSQQFKGIVLFTRKHRENDLLVKIFTEEFGKRMFFIRGGARNNHPLKRVNFPFLRGEFVGKINDEGLSFINDLGELHYPKKIMSDITLSAYATYVCNLVDASMIDNEKDNHVFELLNSFIQKLEAGLDPVILTNIFEIKMLPKFGVTLQLKQCVICGKQTGVFDYSMAFGGLICQKHFYRDERRLHWHPRASHFIRLFSQITYENVDQIHIQDRTKEYLREAIDILYEEYVGIHLKSRSFIDQLTNLKNPLDEKE